MFCPNCGAENRVEQSFCRSCGLKLDAISQAVVDQYPSEEYAALQRRRALFRKLSIYSLSVSGLIGISFLLFTAALYKMILFGPNVLSWAGTGAIIAFVLLSVFFFIYPKLFMKSEKVDPRLSPSQDAPLQTNTSKLIEDRPFEPASVTEHSTELLANDKVHRTK